MWLLISLFSIFSFVDSGSGYHRHHHRHHHHHHKSGPSFDNTGISYHEPLERLQQPPITAYDAWWWLPLLNGDSLQFIRKNHVKTMYCSRYQPDDTVTYFSTYENRVITEYRIGGSLDIMRWDFDSAGRVTSFISYNDTVGPDIRIAHSSTYDKQGFLTGVSDYSREEGISKQYEGYTYKAGTGYHWSDDHKTCDVHFHEKLVSLPGTSRSERKFWDYAGSADEHWEFDEANRPVYYRGPNDERYCETHFKYNANGDLILRHVHFLDKVGGGFVDSIPWVESLGLRIAYHYFASDPGDHCSKFSLLETVAYRADGQIVLNELGDGAVFPDDQFDYLRGRKFVATYDGDQVIRKEERDSLQNVLVSMSWDYSEYKQYHITTTTWQETDTARADTILVVKTYTMDNGLIWAMDEYHVDEIWWHGTWFFPEYFDLDSFEYYRFRYEFY